MASVECASIEIEPYDIAPVTNRRKPADDFVPGLDLLDRDRSGVLVPEVEEAAEMNCPRLLVRIGCIRIVSTLILLSDGILEISDS